MACATFPPRGGTCAALVLAALLCTSCGSSIKIFDDRFEQDIGFGFDDLRKGTLLVAGAAAEPGFFAAEERVRFGSMVSNMFLEQLGGAPGIRVVGTGTAVRQLGLDAYEGFMRNVDHEGGLSREDIPFIDSVAADIRHVLVAYVTNENVMDFADEEYSSDGEEVTTRYEKRYYLTIDFQLYDLAREKMVLSHVLHNEASRTESRTTSTGCVEGCVGSVLQSLFFGTPAEISREEVLSEMMQRFVGRLRVTRPRTRQP